MKYIFAVVAAIGFSALLATPSLAAPQYTVTDLGTLGGTYSAAIGINNAGQVVGESDLAGNVVRHAFLYSGGVMRDLGTLGGTNSSAAGINASGQVVGYAHFPGDTTASAFIYTGGVLQALGTLGGSFSVGLGINDAGYVTGESALPGGTTAHAFLYDGATMHDLGTFGGRFSAGLDINTSGQVTGTADVTDSGTNHAFLYSGGVMQDLGTLGGTISQGLAINDNGLVVGESHVAGDTASHAFLYSSGVMQDLGTLGGDFSRANGINALGQIVGVAALAPAPFGGSTAFVYSAGVMQNLNSLIDPSSGWRLDIAASINDVGQIVGVGSGPNGYNAFLLTPVPEPSSFMLVVLGVLCWLVGRRTQAIRTSRSRVAASGKRRGQRRFILGFSSLRDSRMLRIPQVDGMTLALESLERRVLLTVATPSTELVSGSFLSYTTITGGGDHALLSSIQSYYGSLPSSGTGSGVTIAIVDAFNIPNVQSNLDAPRANNPAVGFSDAYNVIGSGNVTVITQSGATTPLPNTTMWGFQQALEVQWVHAIAPDAQIKLYQAKSDNIDDLMTMVDLARHDVTVSVVLTSWGVPEFAGETGSSYDGIFSTPAGHQPITFIAAAGKNGLTYPSVSPNVLAVGGTELTGSSSLISGENASSNYAGGTSAFESRPAYQALARSTDTQRVVPDVSANAVLPYVVVDSHDAQVLGIPIQTSLIYAKVKGTAGAAAIWAGIVAILNSKRLGNGSSLFSSDGAIAGQQYKLQTELYTFGLAARDTSLPAGLVASPFHDNITNSPAGYDTATGWGSPNYAGNPGGGLKQDLETDVLQYLVPNATTTNTTVALIQGSSAFGGIVLIAVDKNDSSGNFQSRVALRPYDATVQVNLTGSNGNDTLNLRTGQTVAGKKLSQLVNVLSGNSGSDKLVVDDAGTATDYTIGQGTIQASVANTLSVNWNNVGSVTFSGGTTTSSVFVQLSAPTSVTVNAKSSSQSITVGNNGTLTGISTVNVRGGQLVVDDSQNVVANSYVVYNSFLSRTTPTMSATINYSDLVDPTGNVAMSSVLLKTGLSVDTVFVAATSVPTEVRTNGGGDTVYVGDFDTSGPHSLDDLLAALTLDGGVGSNTLVVNDSGSTSATHAYQVGQATGSTQTIIERDSGANLRRIIYGNFAPGNVALNTPANASNSLTVGNLAIALPGVVPLLGGGQTIPAISITGGGSLIVDDSAASTGGNYTITNSTIQCPSGTVTYASPLHAIGLITTNNTNTVNVTGTMAGAGLTTTVNVNGANSITNVQATGDAGATTTINALAVGQTINVGDATHPLSGVAGALTVNGLAGDATALNVNDSAGSATTMAVYTITSGAVRWNWNPWINYTSIKSLGLTTSAVAADKLNIYGIMSGSGARTTITAGASGQKMGIVNAPNSISAIVPFEVSSAFDRSNNNTQGALTVIGGVVGSGRFAQLTVSVAANFPVSIGQQFTVIDNQSASPISQTFSGLTEGAYLQASDGNSYQISYAGGDGNDVVLTRKQIPPQAPRVLLDGISSNYSTHWINTGAVPISFGGAVLSDVDSTNLTSLTATIVGAQTGDVLTANNTGTSISVSFSSGVLTLSGSDSVANYQQVLRTIQYNNTAGGPAAGIGTVTVNVMASDGTNSSSTATSTISSYVGPYLQLDPPSSGDTATWTNTGAVSIVNASTASITDVASGTLTSLTATISSPQTGDVLTADNTGTSISVSFSSGVLTLSGVDSVANYQQVLRTILYNNTAGGPGSAVGVDFLANDGVHTGNTAHSSIAIDYLPKVHLSFPNQDTNATWVVGGGPVAIASPYNATIKDLESLTLTGVTATIVGAQAGDVLSANTTGTSISAIFSGGVLTLGGSDSVAHYQQVLRAIQYDGSRTSGAVTITVTVDDGIHTSATATSTVAIAPAPTSGVVSRLLFYNQSKFDGNTAGVSASDDLAVALDKTAYLPGSGLASISNVSTYSRGINGIIVDLPQRFDGHIGVTAADFAFRALGQSTSATSWINGPAPVTVSARAGAGFGGSDRIEIIWANFDLINTWLEVTVKANANTGLGSQDVFYFGNLTGDVIAAGITIGAEVTGANDEIAVRNNQGAGATVTNPFDFNRSGVVGATDEIIARYNIGTLVKINL